MSLLCLLAPFGQSCAEERREGTIKWVALAVIAVALIYYVKKK